jgi:hypothetical protein
MLASPSDRGEGAKAIARVVGAKMIEDSLNKGASPLVYPPLQREAPTALCIFAT